MAVLWDCFPRNIFHLLFINFELLQLLIIGWVLFWASEDVSPQMWHLIRHCCFRIINLDPIDYIRALIWHFPYRTLHLGMFVGTWCIHHLNIFDLSFRLSLVNWWLITQSHVFRWSASFIRTVTARMELYSHLHSVPNADPGGSRRPLIVTTGIVKIVVNDHLLLPVGCHYKRHYRRLHLTIPSVLVV